MKRIAVYCGSNKGKDSIYEETAKEMAREIVRHKLELVYGGGDIGLMGVIADEVLLHGGHVYGVIPVKLADVEVGHNGLTELIKVESMHDRKNIMMKLSGGFIAMPGGIGTLDEFFEVYTCTQLGFHHKPCGILNINGYFDKLLAFLDHAVEEKFFKAEHRNIVIVEKDPAVLLEKMLGFEKEQIALQKSEKIKKSKT